MRIFTLLAGIVCLFVVLLDAFQTIILPRRASGRFRLTRSSIAPRGRRGCSLPTDFATRAGAKPFSATTGPCR